MQEYIETAPAFPAMLEIGSDKLTGDTIIVDTATSHYMVPAESKFCRHVVNKIIKIDTASHNMVPAECKLCHFVVNKI